MNRPGPCMTWPQRSLTAYFSESKKISTWNSYTIFIEVFNLCYKHLGAMSLTVLKLCAFRLRSNYGNFQQFFHRNFWLKWKIWTLIVLSENFSSDLSEYTLFLFDYFYLWKSISRRKMKMLGYFCIFFFKWLPKFSDFIYSVDCVGKMASKSIRI